jgi:protein gp37
MAEQTQISWTDKTFNPWWGCVKISAGCDNCYAEKWDARFNGNHWGPHATYKTMSDHYWNDPIRWNRKEPGSKVFAGSMCDVFDNHADPKQRDRLFELIRKTPNLMWQLLTKRASNIERFLPSDWGDGYHNVWLGVSVENKSQGLPRINILKNIPAKVRFLSAEPLLENLGTINLENIHWVIAGGESGRQARYMFFEWAEDLYIQCKQQKTAFFFKQMGGDQKEKGGCQLGLYGEIKQWPML